MPKLNVNQRKQLIDQLVVNCDCESLQMFTANDRELLENTADDGLLRLNQSFQVAKRNELVVNQLGQGLNVGGTTLSFALNAEGELMAQPKKKDEGEDEEGDGEISEAGGEHSDGSGGDDVDGKKGMADGAGIPLSGGDFNQSSKYTGNVRKVAKPPTANQWLATAPPEIRSVVQNAMRVETKQKQDLVKRITANARNRFKPEALMRKGLDELTALADLAGPVHNEYEFEEFTEASEPTANYLGAAAGLSANSQGKGESDSDMLIPVTVNWAEESPSFKKKKA